MYLDKYSAAEICEHFDAHINKIWGKVSIAGEEMLTSEALKLTGAYERYLEQFVESNPHRYNEYVDATRPIGGRM